MATQPFRVSPLTPDSGSNFILSVGAVFFDVDTTGISDDMPYADFVAKLQGWVADGASMGATNGDYNRIISHNIEDIETNDRIARVIGLMRMGAIDVSLEFTIQEMTKENYQRIIPTSFFDETGALRSHNQLLPSHFKSIVHVVTRSDGSFEITEIMNALQINEVNTNYTGGTTGATVPLNFVGTAAQLADMNYGAYKIWNIPFPQVGGLASPFASQTIETKATGRRAIEKDKNSEAEYA